MLEELGNSNFIFSGPGSPSYASKTWLQSEIPNVLINHLQSGSYKASKTGIQVLLIMHRGNPTTFLRTLKLLSEHEGRRLAVNPSVNLNFLPKTPLWPMLRLRSIPFLVPGRKLLKLVSAES